MRLSPPQHLGAAFFAWLALLIAGLLILAAWSRGMPAVHHVWILLGVSALPWLTVGANLLRHSAPADTRVVRGATVEHVRDFHLVPVQNTQDTLNGVLIEELLEFIDQVPVRGVTARSWKGDPKTGILPYQFQTGRECDYDTWKAITDMFAEAGILVGRAERKKGRMRTVEPGAIKSALRVHRLL